MKKKISLLTVLLLLLVGGLFSTQAFANEQEEEMPYLIEPVLPDNQDEGITQYISVSPDSDSLTQDFEFVIQNRMEKELDLSMKIVNAYTSSNGIIQYSEEEGKNHAIIEEDYELKRYVDAPENIVVGAGETEHVTVSVDVSNMDGTILGGIAFQGEAEDQSIENDDGSTFEIKNEVNTVYGMAINFPTDQEQVFEFADPFLDPLPSYYVVRLPISLNAPLIATDVELEYTVSFEGEELFFGESDLRFAPMTITNFAIPYDHEEIERDEPYQLEGSISYVDQEGNEQEETFQFEFIYDSDEDGSTGDARTFDRPDEADDDGFPLWSIFLILALLIALILLLVYLQKRNQYVLFSNEKAIRRITMDHPLYELMQPIAKKRDGEFQSARYMHIYKKKKHSRTDDYYYTHIKTKTLLENKS